MRRVDRLKKEARAACATRGHRLTSFVAITDFNAVIQRGKVCYNAICTACGKGVWIDPRPAPNGIDISGEAVALHCEGGA